MDDHFFVVLRFISAGLIVYILHNVKKGILAEKESLVWIFGCIPIAILALFPSFLDIISFQLGIHYPPTLLFIFLMIVSFLLTFRHFKLLTDIEIKVRDMAETISLLRHELEEIQRERGK